MIVSALSFYDPEHASAVPDYQQLSRWDAPFAPTFSDTVDSRHSAFLSGNNSGSASTSGGDFQSIQSAAGFGFHRATAPSGGGQLHPQQPSQSQQHHRQIIPIPRRERGPRHHDLTQGPVQTHLLPSEQGQAQTEQREQRKTESQVRHFYRCPLHLFQC
jgi:hypothetical protein